MRVGVEHLRSAVLGLWSNFSFQLVVALACLVGAALGVLAAFVGQLRRAPRGLDRGRLDLALSAAGRAATPGVVGVVLAGTALPRTWPPPFAGGDLVLGLGQAGLGDLAQVLAAPGDLPAVQLYGNLAMYALVGAVATVGWRRALVALVAASALSAVVEAWQYAALERVAATDDWLLNTAGAAVGCVLGALVLRLLPRRARG